MIDEKCYNCGYETDPESLDAMGYCYNCQMAYEVGFMSALQQLAGKNPSELANLDKLSGDERYTLFVRLLNG